MAFIVGAIIGTVGALAGATIASRGAKRAGEVAAAGSDRDISFQKESRDLARSDQAPYREAGYTALDALMSMTGLGGGSGSGRASPVGAATGGGVRASDYLSGFGGGSGFRGGRRRLRNRAYGGNMYGRNDGGDLYNVNELGPESVYSGGSYTRSGEPMTVPPDPTGYVAPNITGRQHGGALNSSVGYAQPGVLTHDTGINPDKNLGGRMQESPPRPPSLSGPPPVTVDNDTGQPVGGGLVAPRENPGGVEGGYNFMTDPGYEFRIGEGQRALERGASAAGGLLSGGYGRRLTRYAQDYASNEYTNVYNRISNIAGLGQVSAGQSGNAALIAGGRMGDAAAQGATARASGYQASGNAWANAGNQIAQLPWGDVFNRPGQTPPIVPPQGQYTYPRQ